MDFTLLTKGVGVLFRELMLWYTAEYCAKSPLMALAAHVTNPISPPQPAKKSIDFSWPIRLKTIFLGQKPLQCAVFQCFVTK